MRMWRNGRRARFRSLWEKSHAGSSPVIRTNSFERYLKFVSSEWTGQFERVTLAMIVDTVNVRSLFRRKWLAPYKSCHPHQLIWEVSQIRIKRMSRTVWTCDARYDSRYRKKTVGNSVEKTWLSQIRIKRMNRTVWTRDARM